MNDLWQRLAVVALQMTHYLSIAVWVGVMLFNLIVNFPAVRSRSRTPADFTAAMSAQSKRAGPWLYILVVSTFASGWGMALLRGDVLDSGPGMVDLIKTALILAMLTMHMWATFLLWPRIHFALESEWPSLFFKYQVSIFLSSTFGIAAILLTYLSRAMIVLP